MIVAAAVRVRVRVAAAIAVDAAAAAVQQPLGEGRGPVLAPDEAVDVNGERERAAGRLLARQKAAIASSGRIEKEKPPLEPASSWLVAAAATAETSDAQSAVQLAPPPPRVAAVVVTSLTSVVATTSLEEARVAVAVVVVVVVVVALAGITVEHVATHASSTAGWRAIVAMSATERSKVISYRAISSTTLTTTVSMKRPMSELSASSCARRRRGSAVCSASPTLSRKKCGQKSEPSAISVEARRPLWLSAWMIGCHSSVSVARNDFCTKSESSSNEQLCLTSTPPTSMQDLHWSAVQTGGPAPRSDGQFEPQTCSSTRPSADAMMPRAV